MATVWKLQGGTVSSATSLADLGLSKLTRIRRSLARDEITFRADGAAVDSTALFAYGDVVTLTKTVGAGSPVKWFVGVCVEVPRVGTRAGEDTLYRVAGTWWYFENLIFQQNWPVTGISGSRRAMIVAGFAPPTDTRQNTKAFIQDVLDWLIASGTGAVTQYTAADLPTGFDVPFTKLDSPTCAEALQHITRWQPDAAAWFDYTTTPPTFNLKRRGAAASLSFALTALASVNLTPRNELKLDRLVVQYVTTGAGGVISLSEEVDPAGTTGREFGSVVFVLNNDFLPLPAGLAAAYRGTLSTLHYSGEIVIEEDECSQTVHPGHVINVTGGLTAWGTMNAVVQAVTEDIDEGRTTITVGPSPAIRIDDLLEILRLARNQSDQYGGFTEILKVGGVSKWKVLKQEMTSVSGSPPAGNMPTASEISDTIKAAYSGKPAPRIDDRVDITVDSILRYTCRIHTLSSSPSGPGVFVVGFTISGITYYAHVQPMFTRIKVSATITPAGAVPTTTELRNGIKSAFGTTRPWDGDIAILKVSGVVKVVALIDSRIVSGDTSGLDLLLFTPSSGPASGKDFFARLHWQGIY